MAFFNKLLNTAELYDVNVGGFTGTGSMIQARSAPAVLLPNGKVLIAGGYYCDSGGNCASLASAEIYDPATGGFTSAGNMTVDRYGHTMTVLSSGLVLISGGASCSSSTSCTALTSSELYDPTQGTFTASNSTLNNPHFGAGAARLNYGLVVIIGGGNGSGFAQNQSPDSYLPWTDQMESLSYQVPGAYDPTVTLLDSDQILVAGGTVCPFGTCPSGAAQEISDPIFVGQQSNISIAMHIPRVYHTATLLNNGQVLVAGGCSSWSELSSCASEASTELFNPSTGGVFSSGQGLASARAGHTSTLLPNGNVVLIGGINGGVTVGSSELYQPAGTMPPGLVSIAVNQISPTIPVGGAIKLAAIGTFRDGSSEILDSVNWTSSNPGIATISSAPGGNVFAFGVNSGTTNLQATLGTLSGSTTATVATLGSSNPPYIDFVGLPSGGVGDQVFIAGANFGSDPGSITVTFNGVAATSALLSTDLVGVFVPSGATTGPIVVTVSGLSSNGAIFNVTGPPTIMSLSQTSGRIGVPITVTGTNFGANQYAVGGSVSFNGVVAVVTSWSSNSIGAIVPVGAITGDVVITVNGILSNGMNFSIVSPSITSLSPTSGGIGTAVMIAGIGFGSSQGSSLVTFNGANASVTSWNSTTIGVTVPSGASTGNVAVVVSSVPSDGVLFSVVAGNLSGTITRQSDSTVVNGASIQVFQNGAIKGSATSASDGTYAVSSLSTGLYDVRFSAAGLGSVLQTGVTVTGGGTTLNLALPIAGTISGQITQSDGTTTISGATIVIVQSNEAIATGTSDGSGSYAISNLSVGMYSVEASAAGYVTQGQDGVSVSNNTTTTENFSLSGTGTQPIRYVYDSLGRLIALIDTAGDAAGYSYDAVGNLLSITRGTSRQTSVISFTPTKGSVGAVVTIYGTGFSTTSSLDSVSFNGTPATVSAATSTSISVTVPTGASTGTLSVTTPNGTAASTSVFLVTSGSSTGTPTISSFSPSIGIAGAAVTVNGSNFDTSLPNDKLRLNSTLATIVSGTSTSLTMGVPVGATSGHISITTPGGSAASSSDFFVLPSVEGLQFTTSDVVATGRITVGGSTTQTINAASKIGLAIFDGTAGQRISLNPTNVTISAALFIISPSGSVVAEIVVPGFVNSPAFVDAFNLPVTGTYTIFLYALSPGSATLNLYSVTDITGAITPNGSPVTVNITTPGQNALISFSGTAGTSVSLTLSNSTIASGSAQVLNPDGSSLGSVGFNTSGGSLSSLTLPATGSYSIVIDPAVANTGNLTLTLTSP